MFWLCFQFVGGVQIGDDGVGRKRVGWVEGGVVVVVTEAEGRGGQREQLVVGRAVSWQELR